MFQSEMLRSSESAIAISQSYGDLAAVAVDKGHVRLAVSIEIGHRHRQRKGSSGEILCNHELVLRGPAQWH